MKSNLDSPDRSDPKMSLVVHLRIGHNEGDPLAGRILEHIAGKSPEDVVFLSDSLEYPHREKYAATFGFPETCFHPSSNGRLEYVPLNVTRFRGRIVEVMGYYYSPSGVRRCINNACEDLRMRGAHVEMLSDLVSVFLP